MSFQEMSLSGFGGALASTAPTPGGGSASALSGALAAGLVAMVARGTAASKRHADRADEMNAIADESDRLRVELLDLVDEDASAFDQVMAAFRLPKETPAEQSARAEEIQKSYEAAVEPPMSVCLRSLRILELALQVAENGKPNAVSDAGVAALLASTALEGAALNVRINLSSIDDETYTAARAERLGELQAQGQALRAEALAAVSAKLG